MEKELKEKIILYVQQVGVKAATDTANRVIWSNNTKIGDEKSNSDLLVANMRFSLAVLEYLYCDSEMVDKYMETIL